MKKENFVTLIFGAIGGILFALGMCMCLITEWDAFRQGGIIGAAGILLLFAMIFVRRKIQGKRIAFSAKTAGRILLGAVGALLLGLGMCLAMAWELLLPGIAVGIMGILLLLFLIPLCKGVK